MLDSAESPLEPTPIPMRSRLYLMMFIQYFIQGSYLPVISLYLQTSLQFDSKAIGNFSAALSLGPLVAPFILGQLVDRHFSTQRVLSVCHLLSGVLMLVLYTQKAYWPVVILGTLYSVLYIPTLMLTNNVSFYHLNSRDREFPLVRVWGTIGFIVPAWWVEAYWLRGLEGEPLSQARGVILLVAGASGLVMALYSLTLPSTPPPKKSTSDFAPGKGIVLLRQTNVLVLVLVSFGIAVVHFYYFTWNSPFLKTVLDLGEIKGAWEQRIASIGQISEIAVMAALGPALVRFGFKRVMLVGAFAYSFRCVLFAVAITLGSPFSLVLALTCLGQALHGVCFGCFLAVAYMFVDRVSPPDARGSMQNLYGTFVVGLGGIVGSWFSGLVAEWYTVKQADVVLRDWPAIWLVSAGIAAVCFVALAIGFPSDRESSNSAANQEEASA